MGVRAVAAGVTAMVVLSLALAVPAQGAKTRIVRVNPFDSAGDLSAGYRVTARRSGDCPQASFRAVGTLRCFAGNGIYEPCWPDPNSLEHEVVCLRSPFDRRALRILLNDEPGERPSSGKLDPWYVTLSSGKRCGFVGGATDFIAGKRLNYICSRRVALLGTPRKFASRRWRITGARYTPAGFVRGKTATVRVAYYGARR